MFQVHRTAINIAVAKGLRIYEVDILESKAFTHCVTLRTTERPLYNSPSNRFLIDNISVEDFPSARTHFVVEDPRTEFDSLIQKGVDSKDRDPIWILGLLICPSLPLIKFMSISVPRGDMGMSDDGMSETWEEVVQATKIAVASGKTLD